MTDDPNIDPPADPPSDPPADPPSDPPSDPPADPPSDPPVADWRDCCRQALSISDIQDVTPDRIDIDDPLLIEQIQARILPRRGVWAARDEILITMGAQQALYILADLLIGKGTRVGMENPGYPDARNIFELKSPKMVPLAIVYININGSYSPISISCHVSPRMIVLVNVHPVSIYIAFTDNAPEYIAARNLSPCGKRKVACNIIIRLIRNRYRLISSIYKQHVASHSITFNTYTTARITIIAHIRTVSVITLKLPPTDETFCVCCCKAPYVTCD